MIPVVIESPYAGDTDVNLEYLDNCIRDCLVRGETPYASHLMLTSALDDMIPSERMLGIEAGMQMAKVCEYVVAYVDHGESPGMVIAINRHLKEGRQVHMRKIGK